MIKFKSSQNFKHKLILYTITLVAFLITILLINFFLWFVILSTLFIVSLKLFKKFKISKVNTKNFKGENFISTEYENLDKTD